MTNALPTPHNQSKVNKVLDEELNSNVMQEERSLPTNAASIMAAIFIQSDLTPGDISSIYYE
jgi:hypothetical protein